MTEGEIRSLISLGISEAVRKTRFNGDKGSLGQHGSGLSQTFTHRPVPLKVNFPDAPFVGSITTNPGWQVVTQAISDGMGGTTQQWAVVPGILFDTLTNGGGIISVTGCLTPGPIDPTDAAWSNITSAATVQGGYAIWIEGAYSTSGWPAYNSVYINTSDWDGGEVEYSTTTDMDGNTVYVQTFWRFILGFVADFNSDGSPQLVTSGKGILNLSNGGDIGLTSSAGDPIPLPIIYPDA